MPTGYEPLDTLEPVAEGLWLTDGPAIRFMACPFPPALVALAPGAV